MSRKKRKKKKEREMMEVSKTEPKSATNFKLIVPNEVHQKILYWMTKSKNEVSGYGSLEYDEKANTYKVKDVILLKQTVTPTSTELDAHAIGKAMYQMRDEPLGMKWHWHTHPNMGVFWSQDDMEVIRSHGQQGWILASVFNEKDEVRSAFYTTTTVMGKAHDVFQDEIPTHIVSYFPQSFFDQLDEEYKACVTEEKEKWVAPSYTAKKPDTKGVERWEGSWDEDDIYALHPARWRRPSEPDQHDLKFDEFGYAKTAGGNLIYNPMEDQSLKDDDARLIMIGEMDDWEINFLRRNVPGFQKLYSDYVVAKSQTIFPFMEA